MKTTRHLAEMPGNSDVVGGAAYRNRTDDLRITRRIQAVHRCPQDHSCPDRRGAHSSQVQGRPGSLLADPLARSPGQPRHCPTAAVSVKQVDRCSITVWHTYLT
jgi:hypothetical protein